MIRIQYVQRQREDIPFGMIFGGIALAAVAAVRLLPFLVSLPPCTFKSVLGIPCPTCGSGRSLAALAQCDLTTSFVMNPLFSLVVVAALTILVASAVSILFNIPRPSIRCGARDWIAFRVSAAFIVIVNWAYLIVDHR